MRWFVWGNRFVSVSLATDACHFVGLRLAKSISLCQSGICENLALSPAPELFQPRDPSTPNLAAVTCEQAAAVRSAIYASVPGFGIPVLQRAHRAAAGLPEILRGVITDVGTIIIPAMREFLYTSQPLTDPARLAMGRVDLGLLRMSGDDEFWSKYSTYLTGSREMIELERLWRFLVESSVHSPASYDIQTGLTAPFLHFMYDVGSVTGKPGLSIEEAYAMLLVACGFKASHRASLPGELYWPSNLGLTAVESAIVLDKIRRRDVSVFNEFIRIIYHSKPPSQGDASDRIIAHQLSKTVCWQLVELVSIRVESGLVPRFVKAGVSMIAICKKHLPREKLIEASLRLDFLTKRETGLLPFQSPAALDFTDASLPWNRGIDPGFVTTPRKYAEIALSEFVASNDALLLSGGLHVFPTVSDFLSRAGFESVMTGLGRAIGLVVRYGGSLFPFIRLQLELFEAIADNLLPEYLISGLYVPKVERRTESLMKSAILRRVYEPVFFIRQGMKDVLGPAGVDLFTYQEWSHCRNG